MLSLAMFKGTMIISVAIVHLYASSCDAFFAHPGPWCTQNTCRSTKSPQPQMQATNVQAPTSNASVDIVLSSGHCAFAAHCGFLEGVERSLTRGRVGAVLGTSSGALVGSLWAAGYSANEICRIVDQESREGGWLAVARKPCLKPWQGLLCLSDLTALLREYLPPTFEQLPIPLAVGVQDADGNKGVLRSGSLPEAVAASLAVRFLFQPVVIDGRRFRSVGARDRTGLSARSRWRPDQRVLVHLIHDRRGGSKEGATTGLGDWVQDPRIAVVRSSRSRSSVFRGIVHFQEERLTALKHMLQIVAPEQLGQLPMIYPDEVFPVYASLDEHA